VHLSPDLVVTVQDVGDGQPVPVHHGGGAGNPWLLLLDEPTPESYLYTYSATSV